MGVENVILIEQLGEPTRALQQPLEQAGHTVERQAPTLQVAARILDRKPMVKNIGAGVLGPNLVGTSGNDTQPLLSLLAKMRRRNIQPVVCHDGYLPDFVKEAGVIVVSSSSEIGETVSNLRPDSA
jgi:hypothetical protein